MHNIIRSATRCRCSRCCTMLSRKTVLVTAGVILLVCYFIVQLSRDGQLTTQTPSVNRDNKAVHGKVSSRESRTTSATFPVSDEDPRGNNTSSRNAPNIEMPPPPQCSDPLCTEFLSKRDRSRFDACLQTVQEAHKAHPQDGQCRFMSQTDRVPVMLVSYPGSGNTWLRGLLETATGVCTGYEMCDISMRVKGFAGENIVSGAVLVVKTHWRPNWRDNKRSGGGGFSSVPVDSAVFLVRNPLHALVAEWNRIVANNFRELTESLTSHVDAVEKDMFGTNSKWEEFLKKQIPRWQFMIKEWVVSHGQHPILVVKYEDLQKNASREVKRVLSFLQMPYRDQEVDERLARGFDSFHRSHKPDFEHYTPGQKQRVLRAINDTIQLLNRSRLSHLLDIHEYLHPKRVI